MKQTCSRIVYVIFMQMKWIFVLNVVGIIIAIIGLITGQYLFLFLLLPLGLNFLIKNNNDE